MATQADLIQPDSDSEPKLDSEIKPEPESKPESKPESDPQTEPEAQETSTKKQKLDETVEAEASDEDEDVMGTGLTSSQVRSSVSSLIVSCHLHIQCPHFNKDDFSIKVGNRVYNLVLVESDYLKSSGIWTKNGSIVKLNI